MSKECPSCHSECENIWQCVDCKRMFCDFCRKWLPLVPLEPECPECVGIFVGRGEKVSCDEESADDEDDRSAETESSYEPSDYDTSTSASDYTPTFSSSSASSGGTSSVPWAVIGFTLIFVVFGLIAKCGTSLTPMGAPQTVPQAQTEMPPPSPQPPPVQFLENTLPGTYHLGQGKTEAELEQSNPYCGAATRVLWTFDEFCHHLDLALKFQHETRLSTILLFAMGNSAESSVDWLGHVDRRCESSESRTDCLRAELDTRLQFLKERIPIEIASNTSQALFKDSDRAQQLWEAYKQEFPEDTSTPESQTTQSPDQ